MEKVTYTVENQQRIEMFFLGIYSLYSFAMFLVSTGQNWNDWIVFLMLGALAADWMVHVSRYKNYLFRAKFAAVMMQVSIVLCATQMEKITHLIPVFMVFVVLLGLFGIEEIIYTAVASTVIIFFYHGFIVRSISFSTPEEIGGVLLQLLNVLLLENVVYGWTKRNRKEVQSCWRLLRSLRQQKAAKMTFWRM